MVIIKAGIVSKCSNGGEVSLVGESTYFGVGGIVGVGGSSSCDTKIEYCYNEGKITLELSNSKSTQVAGIVGNLGMDVSGTYTGYVTNCYNKGEIACNGVASTCAPAGIGAWGRHIVVKNCYNLGKLTKENNYIAKGIWLSRDAALESVLENNYWLNSCGANYGLGGNSNEGAEPKTEEEIKALTETLGDAYTTDTTNINDGYPIFKWQIE